MRSEAVANPAIIGGRWISTVVAAVAAALCGVGLAAIGAQSRAPASSPGLAGMAMPRVSPSAGLAELPAAAQGPVSAALGRVDRSYWVHDGAAVNPPNGLRLSFGAGGVTVRTAGGASLSLELDGSGAPRVSANRVVYSRGPIQATYANGPLGLEQSFVLWHGSAVALTVGGTLHGTRAAMGLRFGSLRYTGLLATDSRGRRLRASIALRGDRLVLSVDPRGASYPIRIDPFVASGDLNESPPASDAFGYSVAVSGTTIAVGAPAHQVGSNAAQGAVLVFTEPKTGWASSTAGTVLTASDGAAHDELGFSLSTNGTTIVASSPYHGASSTIYVFVEHSGTWGPSQAAELSSPYSSAGSNYLPVAISPDGTTIIFGQVDATVSGHTEQGEAFVASEPAGGWGTATPHYADLTASDGAANDLFGLEVAASNGAVVVTGGISGAGSNDVAVYVFVKGPGGWASGTQTAELKDTATPYETSGSSSLAISPDGKTVVGGAPTATVGANAGQGDALIWTQGGGAWASQAAPDATLTSSDGAAGDSFGFSVAATDSQIVVSAPGHTVGGVASGGAIYLFDEPAAGWRGALQQTQELDPSISKPAEAGYSVGFDGATIVAGTRANEQGAFLFTNPAGGGGGGGGGGGPTAVPANTRRPAISGTAKARRKLSCGTGTWTNSPRGYTYQWAYDGTPISGATGSSYAVAGIDEGLTLTCTVTAFNAKGSGRPAVSAGVTVPVPKVKGCPAASGKLSGTHLGRIRLGMTRDEAHHALTKSSTRGTRNEDFFCLTPIGIRVGYGSREVPKALRGKLIWASTASAFYAVRGIRVGATIAAAAKALKLSGPYKVGANTWYLAPNGASSAIFKTRRGIIQEIGIAERSLTGNRKADLKFLHGFS